MNKNTNNNVFKFLTILFIIAIAALMVSSLDGVNGATVNVNNSSDTILNAINNISGNGDGRNIIFLKNGTYSGVGNYNITINSSFNNRNLVIQGESRDGVIIDGKGLGNIFNLTTNGNISFINLTFIGANGSSGGAIFNNGASLNVSACNFISNSVLNEGGAIYHNSGDAVVSDSSFISNNAGRSGGAIFNKDYMILFRNYMTGNTASRSGQMIYNNGTMGVLNLTYLGNRTLKGSSNLTNSLIATLTDDMGNTITGQEISFNVTDSRGNNMELGSVNALEGIAIFNVTYANGNFSVNGDYKGHSRLRINTLAGTLAILNYGAGIFVNSSTTLPAGRQDGSNWTNAFQNISDALNFIIRQGVNSQNSEFIIHLAGSEGGASDYRGGRGNGNLILNSSFTNLTIQGELGKATIDGEGRSRIFKIEGNGITINNIIFKNGNDDDDGGAIHVSGDNFTVRNSNFINNSADGSGGGGAIYSGGSNFVVINSNFINNSAFSNGGAIYDQWASTSDDMGNGFIVLNSNFTGNIARDNNGGAMYLLSDSNVTIKNSNFINNSAINGYSGGAISISGSNSFILENSNFINNSAISYGGAISISLNYFHVSYEEEDGMIYEDYSGTFNYSIINSNFTDNTLATGSTGGAIDIYAEGTVDGYPSSDSCIDFYIKDSSFTGNNASSGGAIYMTNYYYGEYSDGSLIIDFNIDDSSFTANTATDGTLGGGAIYIENQGDENSNYLSVALGLNIDGSSFTANTASGDAGAIYLMHVSNSVVNSSTFDDNSADMGGAIYNTGSDVNVIGSSFTANTASGDAGAIYLMHVSNSVVNSSTFDDNSAD
ncbi:MAG: hypothetical protein LBM96_11310, partial [Methanobrevibacter sp.]|nr:hypothetical protein [Candidatus Methanoflexus mossambicus]